MALFTKKPVTVEASQWFKNGDHPQDYTKDVNNQFPDEGAPPVYTAAYRRENNWEGDVVRYYRHPDVPGDKPCEQCGKPHHVHGWIDTLEQGHRVCPGDWIITGVKGERYPCKPDIFAATYEPAAQPSAQAERAPVVQAVQAREYPPLPWGNQQPYVWFCRTKDTDLVAAFRAYVDADRASSGAAAPFAKDSWQHAVDNQLVAFGRTSQEFANPHEALSWLAIMNMELGQSNAGATTQAVRFMTSDDCQEHIGRTWLTHEEDAAIKAFGAVNAGRTIPPSGEIGGV